MTLQRIRKALDVLNPEKQDAAGKLIIVLFCIYCACAACLIYSTFLTNDRTERIITATGSVLFFVGIGVVLAFLLRERGKATGAGVPVKEGEMMAEVGRSYRAQPGRETMPFAAHVLTVEAITETHLPRFNQLVHFVTGDGQRDTCRVNWLEGFWVRV